MFISQATFEISVSCELTDALAVSLISQAGLNEQMDSLGRAKDGGSLFGHFHSLLYSSLHLRGGGLLVGFGFGRGIS